VNGWIIDASVAIKWVVAEPGSDAAAALLGTGPLRAPDLLLVECANVLWKKQRRGELTADLAGLAARLLLQADVELLPSRPLIERALGLAVQLDHPVYDCLYLAAAVAGGQPLVTADALLVTRGRAAGFAATQLRLLGEP
jgi:predicted nucleic acid-binding protein